MSWEDALCAFIGAYYDYETVGVLRADDAFLRSTAHFDEMVIRQNPDIFRGFHLDAVIIFKEWVAPRKMDNVLRPASGRIHFIGRP